MIKPMLLAVAFSLCTQVLHAQLLKKITGRNKEKTEQTEDADTGEAIFNTSRNTTAQANPALIIGGDERVTIDSSYDYDIAVYQESAAFQGNQLVIDGGEEIVIYYSSKNAHFCIQLNSRSTRTKYYFFGDFNKESQLSLAGVDKIASGDKTKLDLNTMEPVYPGEIGYLGQLLKTGAKRVIAGVACEEYVANNYRHHARVTNTNHAKVTAHVWIPMDPHTLFPGYSFIPDHYKAEIDTMRIQGSYPPVVMPLEMFLQYGNGDKVYTYTREIIFGEGRRVMLTDIIK
ncbi:hypothetical protein MKQ68_14455 [Chitinophaga horti]|uniref:DUF4138 domain-containing protein n=1 Tax=Chitinophaga horti TaxID=2920382 RepID=A0ABY6IVR4_9BACT|nr:hypothetical protein [Chitinophaga horti]UYQ91291.1 hypothetical protein MKQ68_14455 [Chitinophaga horti]